MFYEKIKNKRKNRFINLSDEEIQFTNKKYYNIINNNTNPKKENDLLKLKQITNSSFNRKVVLPIFILLIFFLCTSTLRKKNKQHIEVITEYETTNDKINISREKALTRGRNYLNKCLEGLLFNHKEFTISNEPKITIIVPLYNDEQIIKPVIRSIQNQKMSDIEIILVNDNSKDNSLNIIEAMQKEDPRIKIIKKKKNMGVLYSRSIAVLQAKGKYILNLDHDDFFLDEDLFDALYSEAENGNFDIVSFMEIDIDKYDAKINEMSDGFCTSHPDNLIVRQPELTHFTLFKDDNFMFVDPQIWGKLVKTKVYVDALNLLGKDRYSTFNVINEDLIVVFAISSVAESYKYIRKYGLFHKKGYNTAVHRVGVEHDKKMAIFFAEIVFDISKKEDKRYAVNMIVKVEPPNEETKQYLGQVLKKMIDCEYISENYKERLRKKYKELGFSD